MGKLSRVATPDPERKVAIATEIVTGQARPWIGTVSTAAEALQCVRYWTTHTGTAGRATPTDRTTGICALPRAGPD